MATVAALILAALWLVPGASAADGGISGEVTFTGGGGPVAGAEVCAESETDFDCAPSAGNGTYALSGLEPGDYFVSFEASEANPFVVFQAYPTEVAVESAMTRTGIDAAVVKGGVIAGTVRSASGSALAGIEVCARSEATKELESCDFSASDGSYRLRGVRPGLTEVEFWAEFGYEPQTVHAVSVSAGGTVNAEAHLAAEEGRISGNVYAAANHAPLGEVTVCAIWAEFHETGGCMLTDGSGRYEFFPVPPGQFKVVYSPEPAEVEFDVKAKTDVWPTQFWNQKPTFAAADTLNVTRTSTFAGIDGFLGPGPAPPASSGSSSPQPTTTPPTPVKLLPSKPKPKPLHCGKGKLKKTVKGKARCVKRHARHHRKHRHR